MRQYKLERRRGLRRRLYVGNRTSRESPGSSDRGEVGGGLGTVVGSEAEGANLWGK